MKELTIEEKAEAYDKVSKEVKDFFEGRQKMFSDVTQTLEYLFPELKESKDEREIRKALIHLISEQDGFLTAINGISVKDILAWLEKQGEQKPIWHNEDEEPQRGRLILLIMQSGTPIVAKIIEPNHTFNHGERWAYIDDLLEKQGEQKSKILYDYINGEYVRIKECAIKEKPSKENPYSGVSFEYNGHTWGMCARDNGVEILVDGEIKERVYLFDRPQGKSALETLKEEKADNQNCANPVVKIEPKFKVGDWVVDKEGNISKIMRVDNGFNHIIYACRFIEQKSVFWSSYSENDIRLWDITEDAKDGDVLASNRSIFIFSQEYIAGKPEAHCGIMNGFFIVKPKGCWTNEKCYPATKEQRYALFAKIREAGYEWEDGKKELKKIEQNPAWSEEDEEWKPSEEQIKVLEFFIPYVTKCSVVLQKSKDTLLSLLSDLKKLREE